MDPSIVAGVSCGCDFHCVCFDHTLDSSKQWLEPVEVDLTGVLPDDVLGKDHLAIVLVRIDVPRKYGLVGDGFSHP